MPAISRVARRSAWRNQPRHPSGSQRGGEWRYTGGSVLAANLEPERVNELNDAAEHLNGAAARFESEGGEVVEGTQQTVGEAQATLEQMEEYMGPGWANELGPRFTRSAVNDFMGEGDVAIAIVPESGVAGALAWGYGMGDSDWIPGEHAYASYLGTTGIARGAGSALVIDMLKDVAFRDSSLWLEPAGLEAESWWSSLGLKPIEGAGTLGSDMWQLTADEVKYLASRLD